jgi:hypothetical protein
MCGLGAQVSAAVSAVHPGRTTCPLLNKRRKKEREERKKEKKERKRRKKEREERKKEKSSRYIAKSASARFAFIG